MTFGHFALRTVLTLLPLLPVFTASAAPNPPAEGQVKAEREPVTDPVSIGWDGGWVVHRYSPEQDQWLSSKGPANALPRFKAMSAVGPHAIAIVELDNGYGGWLFDLHTQKWTAIPISPISPPGGNKDPRTCAIVDDKVVVWGITTGPTNGAVLDTKTMKWKPMAEAPVAPRYRAAAGVIGTKLLVWGGYGPLNHPNPRPSGPLTDGAVYDVARDTWQRMPDPPVPMPTYGYVSAVWKDRLVLFGGHAGKVVTRSGLTYDPAANSWEAMPQSPLDVGVQSACAVNKDKLFLWSGNSMASAAAGRSGHTRDAIAYDFKTREWKKLPEPPIGPRSLAYARAHGTKLTVWGGWDSSASPAKSFTDGATYDMDQGVWQKIPDVPGKTPYSLHPGW